MNTFIFIILASFWISSCQCEVNSGSKVTPSVRPAEAAGEPNALEPDSLQLRLFGQAMEYARPLSLHRKGIGDIVQVLGQYFVSAPYIAGTLDEGLEEKMVCRLDGFDCVTFVENTLAMARGISVNDYSYETYVSHLGDLRYRGGEMNGYCSRLHYFTEWIYDNARRGTVEDLSQSLGGKRLEKDIRFMGEHRDSYARMAGNDSLYQCILGMEKRLEELEIYYIPQEDIRGVYDQLHAGDIIATATHIEGLDVTHTGFVYDNGDGTMGFLHASTRDGVTVSPDLHEYIQGNSVQIGIIVARPVGFR